MHELFQELFGGRSSHRAAYTLMMPVYLSQPVTHVDMSGKARFCTIVAKIIFIG